LVYCNFSFFCAGNPLKYLDLPLAVLIVCHRADFHYSSEVRLNWKVLWLAIPALSLPLLLSGCGGVNAGTTVSPASFFLPGLLRNDTPPATNAPAILHPNDPVFASAK